MPNPPVHGTFPQNMANEVFFRIIAISLASQIGTHTGVEAHGSLQVICSTEN